MRYPSSFLFLASEEIWWSILAWTLFLANVPQSYKKVIRESGLFKVWNSLCSILLLCWMVLNFVFSWKTRKEGRMGRLEPSLCPCASVGEAGTWGGWQEKAVGTVPKVRVTPCTFYMLSYFIFITALQMWASLFFILQIKDQEKFSDLQKSCSKHFVIN